MSTSGTPKAPKATNWSIQNPSFNEAVPLYPGDTLTVVVDDAGDNNIGYVAAVYNATDPDPPYANCTALASTDGGFTYHGDFILGAGTQKKVIAYVMNTQDSQINPFTIQSGSGSGILAAAAATRPAALSKTNKPVPVALSLQLDAPVEGAESDPDPLNRPTTLLYSGSPGPECCWLSQPVDSCSDRADAAFWMLTTSDARTWILLLRRGKADVVVYRFTTSGEQSGSFPLQLYLAVGGEGRNWPRTVTLSPAP